jgi:UDP-N-acetylmuramoyl-tripeptide--D-alanyl-D-alanine ligase
MMLTAARIAAITGGTVMGDERTTVTGVSTDSRTIGAGQLFIPLVGHRFDGHGYISQVAAKGVTLFLAHSPWAARSPLPAGSTAVVVTDTLRALGDLAAAHRADYSPTLVGVTGSNGKTTTKEILASILALTGPGVKTLGNLNNLIGLPQTLFQLLPEHRWAVLEMGMSEPGEIDRLAQIASPRVGIVTNAFPAHLESMGSVENVARAKGELFLRLPAGGTAICNADDPLIANLPIPPGVTRRFFGLRGGDVTASDLTLHGLDGMDFILHLAAGKIPVRFHGSGRHNLLNALAAAAAAEAIGAAPETIRAGLEQFRPGDRRFAPERLGPLTLINDSYNANPASMEAALTTLAEVKGEGRLFAALGDMLELGPNAPELHRQVGALAGKVAWRLYLVGEMAPHLADGARRGGMNPAAISMGMSHEEIAADILRLAGPGDLVLVKGSRGMAMERVATLLRDEYHCRKEA